MPIDLSGPIRAAIDTLLADAKKAVEAGHRERAVVDYQQVASLYRRWANETGVTSTKKQLLDNADLYEQHANKVAAGKAPMPAPAGAQLERGEEDEEGLERQIEHLVHRSSLTWSDIGGLEDTKQEIKLAFALSTVGMPDGVNLEGWRAILFYGPPGTGKTMMAAAVSNALQATFFNVPLSSVLSKYFGESSKLTSALFNVARERAPSVVYMDEFESLATQRTGEESGAERRVLSSLLSELDGMVSKSDRRYVLTIAASNVPWLLDKAILSRFQRKVLIPLPDPAGRKAILTILLGKRGLTSEMPVEDIVARTEWFSGRELEGLVRAAVNHMVVSENDGIIGLADKGVEALKAYTLRVRPLSSADWDAGFQAITPVTTARAYELYLRFQKDMG